MKQLFIKSANITGFIILTLLFLGAMVNSYGFHIPITIITNLSIPIFLIATLTVWLTDKDKP